MRAPDAVQTIDAYVEQNGLLVLEAENGTATASASHDWEAQTAQAGYEGTGYRRALPDIGARYEETETANSPSLSWPIYNETGGTYSVWVRGMAPDAAGDSLHVGVDGQAPSTAADLTGFTDEWGWSKVTMAGGDASVDLTTTGEHTLEAYMREDGLRVDRMLLVTDTNYIPSGLGPVESPFQTITETIPGGLGTTNIAYSYDALYRLTNAVYTGAITATFAYDYDPVGNMTAFTETVGTETTSASRTFDGANRLQASTDATGTTSYIYDDNGNLSTVYPPGSDAQNPVGALQYAYDQRNLMLSHETNPDGTAWLLQAEYVYDGANDRLQQVDHTGATPITTTYANDIFGLTQVLMADDGTAQVYNLFGLDLISQDSGVEVRTLLVDGLGSVRVEMVGSVVETATTYSPYGEVLAQTGASGTAYGFTGEQEDSATGLLYLRARYYSVELKTFMSRDPWEGTGWRPATLNYYTYVFNNPTRYIDSTGYSPQIPIPPIPPSPICLFCFDNPITGFVEDFRDSSDLILEYREQIISASRRRQVNPVVTGAIIYHEARSWNRAGGLGDVLQLAIRPQIPQSIPLLPEAQSDISIGMGQMDLFNARRLERLGYVEPQPCVEETIAALLSASAIEYVAAHLQYLGEEIDAWFVVQGVKLETETHDRLIILAYNQGWNDSRTKYDLRDQLEADTSGDYQLLAQDLAYSGENTSGVFINDYVIGRVWTDERIRIVEELLGVSYE
ncbi:MAG TPA: RHS repeat-associated core domain-containing protein [Candidatus Sulfomarinibacteraceae bacterium]|nr:RHS repeat-associated core domain-containing protein [Candidatus Sulfomarinibacteraceae bacterium]